MSEEKSLQSPDETSAQEEQQPAAKAEPKAHPVIEYLRHPLVVLLVGSLVGSIVIPYINARSTETRLFQEARLRKATEIMNHSREFSSEMNSLMTAIGSYHFDNIRMRIRPAEYKQTQKEFNKKMNDRYIEFDKKAWWWYGSLLQEAAILKLASQDDLRKIDEDIKKYAANVNEHTGVMGELWHAVVSPDYDPHDEKIARFIEVANKKVAELSEDRRIIIEHIIQVITSTGN